MNEYNIAIWALTIWREARGQSYEEKVAIAHVINNRAMQPKRFKATQADCCLQPWQFSCYNDGDPNATKFPWTSDPQLAECFTAINQVITGGPDPTNGCDHYNHLPWDKQPKYAPPRDQILVIGKGKFFKAK